MEVIVKRGAGCCAGGPCRTRSTPLRPNGSGETDVDRVIIFLHFEFHEAAGLALSCRVGPGRMAGRMATPEASALCQRTDLWVAEHKTCAVSTRGPWWLFGNSLSIQYRKKYRNFFEYVHSKSKYLCKLNLSLLRYGMVLHRECERQNMLDNLRAAPFGYILNVTGEHELLIKLPGSLFLCSYQTFSLQFWWWKRLVNPEDGILTWITCLGTSATCPRRPHNVISDGTLLVWRWYDQPS